MTLNPPPIATENQSKLPLDTTLILSDGTKVRVANLKTLTIRGWISAWEAQQGLPGHTSYTRKDDMAFIRGKTVATATFQSLASIDFGEKGEVTVTTKDGKKATGTLPNDDSIKPIDGFTGFSENGIFFISPTLVKSIQFDSTPATDTTKP